MVGSRKIKGKEMTVSIDQQFKLKEGDSALVEDFKVTLDRVSILENSQYTVRTRVSFTLEYKGKTLKADALTQVHQSERMYPPGLNPTIGGLSIAEYDINIEESDIDRREVTLRISKKE